MRVVSLGSGSSGNATLVEVGATRLLVDAGFMAGTIRARLRQWGVAPQSITAVLLTHEHSDHTRGAVEFANRFSVPLIANQPTLDAVTRAAVGGTSPARQALALGGSLRLGTVEVMSFPISHDAVAPCGFLLSSGAWRVCVATDTGEVTPAMAEALRAAHVLVIEANHDEERLLRGPYPWHLKRRIQSATGHLSNLQTAAALAGALDESPRWVCLAHLSRTNNTPELARATVRQHLRQAGLGHAAIQVAPPGPLHIWDSATLWGAAPAADATPTGAADERLPAGADALPPAVTVARMGKR
ncbi:MAG TPA: MBL fold metallo-hydrolase, partial [Ktedonobacterales bacterium]|nr:MBL fold metallo-hydrolase [Ktedonobacterales bacterium]